MHCLNARCPVIGHGAGLEWWGVRIRITSFRKGKSPVLRGFQPWMPTTTTFFSKIGTPPAITQALPSFGDLGTGRPGIPSFTPRLITLTATSPTRFGDLGTGRPGIPSFTPRLITLTATSPPVSGTLVQAGRGFPLLHQAHRAHSDEPARFGDLGTGRPGIPSFIPPADGSAASSAHRPCSRPTRHAAVAPLPGSAATPHPPP